MKRILFLLGLVLGGPAFAAAISVADHGAVPNDGADDGPAVRAALEAARGMQDPVLVFPAGRYDFAEPPEAAAGAIEIKDYKSLTLRGEKAELVGRGLKALVVVRRCGHFVAEGLSVDWDPLPFTAGEVVETGEDYCDVEIAPGHPALEKPVEALFALEPEGKAFIKSSNSRGYLLTQPSFDKKAELVSPNVLRIFRSPEPDGFEAGAKQGAMPVKGTLVVAYYHVRGGGAFQVFSCENVTFSDVAVYSAPGMGFMVNNSEAGGTVRLRNCRVIRKPESGRWKTTTVDATHFNMNRGRVEVTGCLFEDMGDDGSNVHGAYSMVHERVDAATVIMRGWTNPFVNRGAGGKFKAPSGQFRVGDRIEFSGPERRHVSAFEAGIVEVSNVEMEEQTLRRVKFGEPLPEFVGPGTIVANANEVAEFFMKDTTVRRNRGQGVRIKTRNALVEDCLFEDNLANGIWIMCDADYGHESISSRNVTIRNCTFRRAVRAVKSSAGRREPLDANVHENLIIEGCTMERCSPTPIVLQSVKGAVIRKNIFQISGANPVAVTNSHDVRLEDNTILPP